MEWMLRRSVLIIFVVLTAPSAYHDDTYGDEERYGGRVGKWERREEEAMGLDGGTKISRSDVLRGASWQLAHSDGSRSTRGGDASALCAGDVRRQQAQARAAEVERKSRFTNCPITGESLSGDEEGGVVCSIRGTLYSKRSVLLWCLWRKGVFVKNEDRDRYENLLLQTDALERFDYLTKGKRHKDKQNGTKTDNTRSTFFEVDLPADLRCPLSQKHLTKCSKVVAIRKCGHLYADTISSGASRSIESSNYCMVCGIDIAHGDRVELFTSNQSDCEDNDHSQRELGVGRENETEVNASKKRRIL